MRIKIIDKEQQHKNFPVTNLYMIDAFIDKGMDKNNLLIYAKNYQIMENGQEGEIVVLTKNPYTSTALIRFWNINQQYYTIATGTGWQEISDTLSKKEPSKKGIYAPCTWEFGKLL